MIFFNPFCRSVILANVLVFLVPSVSLCGESRNQNTLSFTIFQDFKAVLMFFSEPFLKGAKFGNRELEGENPLVMPCKFVKIIEEFFDNYKKRQDGAVRDLSGSRIKTLSDYMDKLKAGTEVASKIIRLAISNHSLDHPLQMISEALTIQNEAIEGIDQNKGIIIPSGWSGHDIVLIIELAGNDLYNFTVVNTGEGLQYHYHRDDPDNLYPHLSRLWIEFKNIPRKEIFDSRTAWLFCALASLKQVYFNSRLKTACKEDT